MAPALPPRPIGSSPSSETAWNDLVDAAGKERLRRLTTLEEVATSGELDGQLLCRYAAGAAADAERRELEDVLARTPWARDRVVALLRGARGQDHGGLAARLLEAARSGEVDPERAVGQAILAAAGRDDGLALVARGAAPAAVDDLEAEAAIRGACLLGLGERAAARGAFEAVPDASPLVRLGRRVAEEDDRELALLRALDVL